MGNSKSNEETKDFFTGFSNTLTSKFDQGFSGIMNTVNAPGNLANSVGQYINSPLGGIMLPILIVGGLFVVSSVISNRR